MATEPRRPERWCRWIQRCGSSDLITRGSAAAAVKLAAALEAFGIDATDRIAFDVGASTGGFTDVWLQRGARHVIALDVGHSQLHWKVRSDPRVTVIENTNARHLKPGDLPDAGAPITRVSIDVSFISLRHIFPVLPALVSRPTDIVALVKPSSKPDARTSARAGSSRIRRCMPASSAR
jgi:23S rRNA (cytidine1920-2'-O)/16S rRNA (cytidine1409-2'-O)-methyltransferase